MYQTDNYSLAHRSRELFPGIFRMESLLSVSQTVPSLPGIFADRKPSAALLSKAVLEYRDMQLFWCSHYHLKHIVSM